MEIYTQSNRPDIRDTHERKRVLHIQRANVLARKITVGNT